MCWSDWEGVKIGGHFFDEGRVDGLGAVEDVEFELAVFFCPFVVLFG